MKTVMELLNHHDQVSDYKINIHQKESCELFFVKGALETVRRTDTCDKEVTVYVQHDQYMGDSQFLIYPSTTDEQLRTLINEAATKARLICNPGYSLPDGGTGSFAVESNFRSYAPAELASLICDAVFAANTVPGASLNSVEVFINKHTETVINSRGLHKTQVRYDAMVEAIPTYNGETQSVELYEQYNFSSFDAEQVTRQIARKLAEVKARYEAVTPDFPMGCKVILNKLELAQLFGSIARELNYATVYAHSNLYKKGDAIQKAPTGDKITLRMEGQAAGCIRSANFDSDGLALNGITVVENGVAVNYYGANRFGQYLGEEPTGNLRCVCVAPGTATDAELKAGPYLEIISMSGLQVDTFTDYIGGEVRLAYYHDGGKQTPVTGISVSGKLSQVLDCLRLSVQTATHDGYTGPEKAILQEMKIY